MKKIIIAIIKWFSSTNALLNILNYFYEILPNVVASKIEPYITPPNFNFTWKIKIGNKSLNFTYFKGEDRTVFHFPLSYKKNDYGIRKLEILLHDFYSKDRVYLDIGSNYGLRSLYYAAMDRKCFLLEPNQKCLEITNRLIHENSLSNVNIVNCVVGNESKNVEFHLSKNTYLSSLSKAHSENYNDYLKTIEMKMIRIDDFLNDREILDQVSLVKIDVEGFEFDVLKGCENLFKNNNVTLIIEVLENAIDRTEIFNYLKLNGFEIYGILKSYTMIKLLECNEDFSLETIDFICSKEKNILGIFRRYLKI